MKNFKKLSIFVILFLVLAMMFTTVAFAVDGTDASAETNTSIKLDKDLSGEDMTFGERLEYALQGTVTGMLMVFAVLGLLFGIISLSKVVFYDIPNKKKERELAARKSAPAPVVAVNEESAPAPEVVESAESADDGELAAVITAAIAAMLDSEEYKNEFVGGFRVVSFKRSANSAWNKR